MGDTPQPPPKLVERAHLAYVREWLRTHKPESHIKEWWKADGR